MRQYHYIAIFFMLLSATGKAYAQPFFWVDTADKRISQFRYTIREKENLVRFIEYSLNRYRIPTALRNLALIESSFRNNATSVANAAGIWQLTPAHAAYYGLSGVDRYDILKSTGAAMRTIINLYNRYTDWRIVVAAYNCGEGNVNKAILKAHSSDYDRFSAYLPAETRMHVYKFLLACYASGELKQLNIPAAAENDNEPLAVRYAEAVTCMVISGGYALPVIAERLQLSQDYIRLLNPGFENDLMKTGATKLVLPVDKMPDFLLQKNEILVASLN